MSIAIQILKNENATIALLFRDNSGVEDFQEFIKNYNKKEIPRIGLGHHSDSKTIVSRIPDVKGLEYDGVILVGLEQKSKIGSSRVVNKWAPTEFNKRLLYSGVTRARHYLGLHWLGLDQESEIIKDEVGQRAVNVIQH